MPATRSSRTRRSGSPGTTSRGGRIGLLATLLAALTLPPVVAQTPSAPLWIEQIGSSATDAGQAIATDPDGNVFVAGYVGGSLDGMTYLGEADLFVVKLDPNGLVLWGRQLGSTELDAATGVATDAAGDVYVVGQTFGGLDGAEPAGDSDVVVVKLSADGDRIWTRQFGSEARDVAVGIAAHPGGDVLVVGFTSGALDDVPETGAFDTFVVRLDAAGNRVWLRQLRHPSSDIPVGIAVDAAGSAFVAGYTFGGLYGNPNLGESDLFVHKLDAGGERLWTRQFGSASSDGASAVATDPAGNIVVVGSTLGSFEANPHLGADDLVVLKLDPDGTLLWSVQLGTAGSDDARGVATDPAGNVVVVGGSDGALEGFVNRGGDDLVVIGLGPDGRVRRRHQLGSEAGDLALAVASDGAGNLYVAGVSQGALDGDDDFGANDVVMVKFGP